MARVLAWPVLAAIGLLALVPLTLGALGGNNHPATPVVASPSSSSALAYVEFGSDADTSTLRSIANQTGGAAFSATDVVQALRQATGYK